jgi:AcrR family transcriptional regulator
MSRTVTSTPAAPRKAYHHGALKDAMVTVAEQLLSTRGPAGFTLTDVARAAGVSAAAPYRHFADREALLAEVARRGFIAFAARLSAAMASAGNAADGFQTMGASYLAFARENPGAYTAMFSGPLAEGDKALDDAGSEAFGALMNGIRRALEHRLPPGTDAFALAGQIWAMAHGVATLEASGRLGGVLGSSADVLLRNGVSALISGTLSTHR